MTTLASKHTAVLSDFESCTLIISELSDRILCIIFTDSGTVAGLRAFQFLTLIKRRYRRSCLTVSHDLHVYIISGLSLPSLSGNMSIVPSQESSPQERDLVRSH
jgi:hypothetical protein